MEPGSTAGVLIWENLWAAPFASAARRAGGQLIANGRIPLQAIIASIEADETIRNAAESKSRTGVAETLTPDAGQGAGNQPLAPRSPCVDAQQPQGMP